jgi:chromosome segregation ATPase
MNLRRAQRKHDKELAAVEQQARDLEHATGSLQAHVQHMRRDQEDLRSAELNLQSKEHPVLQRQARVGHLEEELTRLEAQVNNNIQLNNEMGKKVKQSRADWAEASRQAIAHHSSTLNRVHEEFQERDRLASERKAAINALANDLKDQTGVLNGVKSELGTADASITTLRGAIQDTQDQLKACQDKRLHEHLADEMDNFSDSLPTEPEPPSQDEVFIKKVGDLADSMAEPDSMAESSQLSSTEPSDVGPEPSDDPLDKIGQLAELLKL